MTTRPSFKRAALLAATAVLLATAASAGIAGDPTKRCARLDTTGKSFDDDGQRVKVRGSTGESGRRVDQDYELPRPPAPRVRPSHAIDQDDPAMVDVGARTSKSREAERECE